MSTEIDFKVLELLTSKVCHDLISPIGAVNNGMEFVDEMGPEAGQEVFELIGFSAGQASAKLQAYRMAYGAGGADSSIKPEEVHSAIEAIVGSEDKVKQEWDPYAPLGPEERPEAFAKIMVLVFLMVMDCMPKGGTLTAEAGDNDSVILSGKGEDAGLREDIQECLDFSISTEQLTPKNIHPYVTSLIVKKYGYGLSVKDMGDNAIGFILSPPQE